MAKIGLMLLLIGICALVGYWLFFVLQVLYSSKVALLVKVAVPLVLLGVGLCIGVVVRDRIKARKAEDFEEARY